MDLELSDKVAIVTGGSRGIGKAIALALASEGASVALIARDLAATEATAAVIAKKTGTRVGAYRADSGIDAEVRQVVEAIARDFGRIDILVNCAAKPAGQAPPAKLAEITDELFWTDVNTKVGGYLRFAREVAPHMKARGFGRIINVAGLAARQTGSAVGSIRNVAVAALTKNLADELGPFGINAVCVHPGLTRTEKTAAVIERQAEAAGVSTEAIEEQMRSGTSIRHLVTAEEVAHVVAFLASPKAIAISGDAIAAGGGKPGSIYY